MAIKKVFQFGKPIADIVSVNESFDQCTLRICYAGKNRNGSVLPRSVIEKALPSMPYCPIVTHYDIDNDTLGGHDLYVKEQDGRITLLNLTDAVGVVPENAEVFWETVTEDDGTEHEYLCTHALLWKRAAAYAHLKEDGGCSQSMEIDVKDGHYSKEDEAYVVDDFAFEAFALIGVEPCFESADMQFVYSASMSQYSKMIEDFKLAFRSAVNGSDGTDTNPKGGRSPMKFEEMLAKYGLTKDDITFSVDGMSEDELERKLAEMSGKSFEADGDSEETVDPTETGDDAGQDTPAESQEESSGGTLGATNDNSGEGSSEEEEEQPPVDDGDDDVPAHRIYELTNGQTVEELRRALSSVKYQSEWSDHQWNRYDYMDHDAGKHLVYAYDGQNEYIVGMPYELSGDAVTVDFSAAKRMKVSFVEFEGSEGAGTEAFAVVSNQAKQEFATAQKELDELRAFKKQAEDAGALANAEQVFAMFQDLSGNEKFEKLVESVKAAPSTFNMETVEEKCYAIRGRMQSAKFALESNDHPVRIPIGASPAKSVDEPYNGLFVEYGK